MHKYKSRHNPGITHLVHDITIQLHAKKTVYRKTLCGEWVTGMQKVDDNTECTCRKCKRVESE